MDQGEFYRKGDSNVLASPRFRYHSPEPTQSTAPHMRGARRKLLFESLIAAGLAAARRYGPEHGFINSGHAAAARRRMVSTVPSWVSSLAVGEQYRIPNSSFWGPDVVAQYTVAHPDLSYTTGPGPEGFIHLHGRRAIPRLAYRMSYSGAGWNPDGCEFYLFGGGHAASFGNEVLRFRANAERPAWEVLGQPSDASAVSFCRTGEHVPPLTWSGEGGYNLDGKPKSAHMCTRNFYLGSDNSLWNFGGGVTYAGGQSTIDRFDCATRSWSASGTYGSGKAAWNDFTPNLGNREYRDYGIVDARDDTVYLIKHASGRIYKWRHNDPLVLKPFANINKVYNYHRVSFFIWPTCIDTQRNCIIVATGGTISNGPGPLKIVRIDLATGEEALDEVTWRIPAVQFWNGHSMEYDSHGDRYLIKTVSGDFFYTIDAKTLNVGVLKFTGDSQPVDQVFWTLNHLRYSPELKGTLFVSHGPRANATHEGCSVYFVRLHK